MKSAYARIPTASILVSLSVIALTSACNSSQGSGMEDNLTEMAARQQIVDYMSRTIGILPKSISFKLESPTSPGARFGPGTVAPCDDNDHEATGPVNLALNYWVHGVRPSDFDDNLHNLVGAWKGWGWSATEEDSPGSTQGKAGTPDGYTLIIEDNHVGGYSITGVSPCFPRANTGTSTPQPASIEHPAQ